MMEPLPYPCMPQYTFNSVSNWTQLEIIKSGNFSIYMYTIWHTLFTVDHANISYSTKIWQAIYLAKCPKLAFDEFYIRQIAMPIYNYYNAIADNCLNGRWYCYVKNR